MAYTDLTLVEAKTQLAIRLGDPNKVFWTDAEIGIYIVEALRTWGALTLYWKSKETITTVDGQVFYNIPASVSNSMLTRTITDQALATVLEYHLMEPPTPSTWTGSELYTLSDLQHAIQNRLTQFVMETGFGLGTSSQAVNVDQPTVTMAESVVEIRRAWWRTPDPLYRPLFKTDEHIFNLLIPDWPTERGTPLGYSIVSSAPLTVALCPIPNDTGAIEFITLNTGTETNLATGIILAVPDDLAWVIKWGALADLFAKDGPSRDMNRSEYCEQRWREGLEIARQYPAILSARFQERPLRICSLYDLDMAEPGWQETGEGNSTILALAGYDLGTFYPRPDGNLTQISLDVVRKAPIPSLDADIIQIGREHYTAILDYAQHLALVKVGGKEFLETTKHYDRMVRAAAVQNTRIAAQSSKFKALTEPTFREESQRPRFVPDPDGV